MEWQNFLNKINTFFQNFGDNIISYVMEFILFIVLFYYVFKVLQTNKNYKFIAIFVLTVAWCGLSFAFSENIESQFLLIVIIMLAILIFTMYNTEIKRVLLDSMGKAKNDRPKVTASGVDVIIEEMIRAIQNMSKNMIGALIVLSNENLPEGIIESGTIVNAEITSQMIEAVFYPKAPLHDGAMIVEGSKIYEYPFIPRSHGDFEIPAIRYSYYDINAGRYVTLTTRPVRFHVEKGKEDAAAQGGPVVQGVNRSGVKSLNEDIRFITTKMPSMSSKGRFFVFSTAYWISLAGLAILAFLLWLALRKMAARRADIAGTRTRKASKMAVRWSIPTERIWIFSIWK